MGLNVISDEIYCERNSPEFNLLGEPINLFSNFFQIGLGLSYCYRVRNVLPRNVELLGNPRNVELLGNPRNVELLGGILYTLVGIGSSIWHSFGLTWTLVLDLFFPALFILWFSYHWTNRVLGIENVCLRFVALGFISGLSNFLGNFFQVAYIDGHWSWSTTIVLLGLVHKWKSNWKPNLIIISSFLYGIALVFYALDTILCDEDSEDYQLGYHWVWHIFSSLGGFCLLLSLPPLKETEQPIKIGQIEETLGSRV